MRAIEWFAILTVECSVYVVASTALKILECPLTLEDRKFEQWVK